MIYLHAILPVFFLPTGITILLVLAGIVLRRRSLCALGIAVLWLASTSLVGDAAMRAAEGWQVRKPASSIPECEAIVVLSGGRIQAPGDLGVSEWADANRFYGGVELYKAGKAPLLIFTGGWVPWQPDARPEGDVLISYAMDLGIPRDGMLTTAKVVNTNAEARAVAHLLAERSGAKAEHRVILVTSAFHMRRAQMLFARAGVETVPFPVDFKVSAGKSFTLVDLLPRGPGQTETALREFYGLLYYGLLSLVVGAA